MVEPQNTTMMIDTDQINGRCAMGNHNYGDYDKKRVNLVENTMRNQKEGRNNVQDGSSCMLVDGEVVVNENGDINEENKNQGVSKEVKKRGLTLDMEFEGDVKEDECVEAIMKVTIELLTQWRKNDAIEGVATTTDGRIISEFNDVNKWARTPRIIITKKHTKVEIMLEVKTSLTAYELYQREREYCDKINVRIGSKNTCMEYTKKIGFLVGAYVKIASPKYYINELSNIIETTQKVIDIKKSYTYEKGLRSRVLVVYAIESEAKEIDEWLSEKVQEKRYRYISYRNSPSQEKLSAMYFNDMKNVKAKYETLFNVQLKDEVMYDDSTTVTLEKALMDAKVKENKLFLAAEQGSGKYENDVTVILNPKMKVEAWKWLTEEYGQWDVYQENEHKTSVDLEKCQGKWKYNESLKEFLKPAIQNVNLKTNKYGKKIKSHAQVLGINVENEEKQKNESKTFEHEKKERVKEKNKDVLKNVIESMKNQINELQIMIQTICNSLVKDEDLKQRCLDKINQMRATPEKDIEQKSQEESERNLGTIIMQSINKGKRKEVEKKEEKIKIINHPNATNDSSGDVNEAIRKWYKTSKEEKLYDQQIRVDQKVKKLRQR